jgi:Cupin
VNGTRTETIHGSGDQLHVRTSRIWRVDSLAALLDGPRARGAVVLRAVLDPPFGIRVEDGAPLTLVTVVRGEVWVRAAGRPPARVGPGGLAVVRGPEPYTVADAPDSPVRTVILPGQRSATVDGEELCDELDLGCGCGATGSTATP